MGSPTAEEAGGLGERAGEGGRLKIPDRMEEGITLGICSFNYRQALACTPATPRATRAWERSALLECSLKIVGPFHWFKIPLCLGNCHNFFNHPWLSKDVQGGFTREMGQAGPPGRGWR